MTGQARYHIPDEPRASGLSHLVVDPIWPLFAQMLAGSWIALPWFALNASALGSPTRVREWGLLAASAIGSALLVVFLTQEANAGSISGAWLRIAVLSIVVVKIGVAYAVYFHQSRVLEIWEHFGGKARNGLPVLVLAAAFGRTWVLAHAGSAVLRAVLS